MRKERKILRFVPQNLRKSFANGSPILLYLIVLFSAIQGGVNCNILSNSGGGGTSRKNGVKQLFYHPEFYPLTALVND